MDPNQILGEYRQLHGKTHVFPGSNPVSIERRHYSLLLKETYLVTEKTNGVRYMMFVKMIGGVKVVALINRRQDVCVLDITLPDMWYNGTILDGEVAVNKQTQADDFLVFDVLFVNGRDVSNDSFTNRCNVFHHTLQVDYSGSPRPLDPLTIHMKTFTPLEKFEDFLRHYDQVQRFYDTDGLVFTPESSRVIPGKNENMFKWKLRNYNTCDFLIKIQKDSVSAFVYNVPEKKMRYVTKLAMLPDMESNDVWECQYERFSKSWKPLLKRTDKKYPNALETYNGTLINIQENIKIFEFQAIAFRKAG